MAYSDILNNYQRTPGRKASDIASELGLDYNAENIKNMFSNSVEKNYEASAIEQEQAENAFYDNARTTQQTAMDTIRRNNNAAVATGASRGMQAANELAAILGLQQENTKGATQLALDQQKFSAEKAAALAASEQQAYQYYNQLGLSLNEQAISEDANATQFDAAKLGALGQYGGAVDSADIQAKATIEAAKQQATATREANAAQAAYYNSLMAKEVGNVNDPLNGKSDAEKTAYYKASSAAEGNWEGYLKAEETMNGSSTNYETAEKRFREEVASNSKDPKSGLQTKVVSALDPNKVYNISAPFKNGSYSDYYGTYLRVENGKLNGVSLADIVGFDSAGRLISKGGRVLAKASSFAGISTGNNWVKEK